MNNKGFTLLELLFALFIWVVGFLAVAAIFQIVVFSALSAKNQLIASNLAQEGIEIIHNIRDSNYVASGTANWDKGLINACFNNNCEVSYRFATTSDISDDTPLKYSTSTDSYAYFAPGPDISSTIFKRYITLQEDAGNPCSYASSGDCIQIVSQVNWQERGRTRSVEVEDYIFNWD